MYSNLQWIFAKQAHEVTEYELGTIILLTSNYKIQIGFTFLVPAHLGSPGQRAIKRVCVCVCNYNNRLTVVCQGQPG